MKEHLEKNHQTWAVKVLRETREKGFKLHHNAILALFEWIKKSKDYHLCDEVSAIITSQGVTLDDSLAKTLIIAQAHISAEEQPVFSRWCHKLLWRTRNLAKQCAQICGVLH